MAIKCQIKAGCLSRLACSGFGYCRERNMAGMPTSDQAKQWQSEDDTESVAWCIFCKKDHAGGATCMGYHP